MELRDGESKRQDETETCRAPDLHNQSNRIAEHAAIRSLLQNNSSIEPKPVSSSESSSLDSGEIVQVEVSIPTSDIYYPNNSEAPIIDQIDLPTTTETRQNRTNRIIDQPQTSRRGVSEVRSTTSTASTQTEDQRPPGSSATQSYYWSNQFTLETLPDPVLPVDSSARPYLSSITPGVQDNLRSVLEDLTDFRDLRGSSVDALDDVVNIDDIVVRLDQGTQTPLLGLDVPEQGSIPDEDPRFQDLDVNQDEIEVYVDGLHSRSEAQDNNDEESLTSDQDLALDLDQVVLDDEDVENQRHIVGPFNFRHPPEVRSTLTYRRRPLFRRVRK